MAICVTSTMRLLQMYRSLITVRECGARNLANASRRFGRPVSVVLFLDNGRPRACRISPRHLSVAATGRLMRRYRSPTVVRDRGSQSPRWARPYPRPVGKCGNVERLIANRSNPQRGTHPRLRPDAEIIAINGVLDLCPHGFATMLLSRQVVAEAD